ncbi:MAG TPA: hypothetical protein VNO30_41755 [Kofleriaceae bacterium]|nr:hypothetical protein [Kofleriaceae bacterium]
MPKNHFDLLAKEIGQKALHSSGTTLVNQQINPEIQYADLSHVPDPAREAERDRLGLLGRLAAIPCLIEVYSEAPGAEDFRACLAKHLASWQARARDHKKRSEPQHAPEKFVDSFLWIIAAGAPKAVLAALRFERLPARDWPLGVYTCGADVLRVGIVVATELPRNDASTLLVRIMAAGPLLEQAVGEVAALPSDAHERVIAEPVLISLQQALEQDPSKNSPDEKDFIMAMNKSWDEGRAEARAENGANAVLIVLDARGLAVSEADRLRILAQRDPAQLERWLRRAAIASSVVEVIDEPS